MKTDILKIIILHKKFYKNSVRYLVSKTLQQNMNYRSLIVYRRSIIIEQINLFSESKK